MCFKKELVSSYHIMVFLQDKNDDLTESYLLKMECMDKKSYKIMNPSELKKGYCP